MTDHIIKAARSIWGESAILPFAELARFYAITRAEALEDAANVCERIWPSENRSGHEWSDGFADGTCDCAEAIRKLKEQQHG